MNGEFLKKEVSSVLTLEKEKAEDFFFLLYLFKTSVRGE